MAKRRAESCLFCGCTPCECDPKKKRVSTPRKPAQPPVAPPLNPSDLDFGSIEKKTPRFKVEEVIVERDLPFINALRSLRDIVSERDQRWIDTKLYPSMSQNLDRRVSEWRAKHGKAAYEQTRGDDLEAQKPEASADKQ